MCVKRLLAHLKSTHMTDFPVFIRILQVFRTWVGNRVHSKTILVRAAVLLSDEEVPTAIHVAKCDCLLVDVCKNRHERTGWR